MGKCVMHVTKHDVIDASVSLHVCAGHKSESEAAILACVQTSPLPQKKSGEETISSEEGGTSVHRLLQFMLCATPSRHCY